jgi:hypothetical protein
MDEDNSSVQIETPKQGTGVSQAVDATETVGEPAISEALRESGSLRRVADKRPKEVLSRTNTTGKDHVESKAAQIVTRVQSLRETDTSLRDLSQQVEPQVSTRSVEFANRPHFIKRCRASEIRFDTSEPRLQTMTGHIFSPARKLSDGVSLRFSIPKTFVQQFSGISFEVGKRYEIKWGIENIGECVGRFRSTVGTRLFLYVPKGCLGAVKAGETYMIAINSVIEKPRFEITSSHAGPRLRLAHRELESMGLLAHGAKGKTRAVLAFSLTNISRPRNPIRKCFARYNHKERRLDLYPKPMVKLGDLIGITKSTEYTTANFVVDFNSHRLDSQPSLLLRESGSLIMIVQGREIELANSSLKARGSRVVLSARLAQTKRELKFWFDGEAVALTFVRNWKVLNIRAAEYGLVISYSQSAGKQFEYRRNFGEFDASALLNNIRLVSAPGYPGGPYVFEVEKGLQEMVHFRVHGTGSLGSHNHEKGFISERVQRYLISITKLWNEVKDHPHESENSRQGSKRHGPDSLQRSRASNELHYFEFKWWKNTGSALSKSFWQAERYVRDYPTYEGEPVKAIYAGILDWNSRDTEIRWYVHQVWPRTP